MGTVPPTMPTARSCNRRLHHRPDLQVSDTTVADPKIRRTVLIHAFVSYLFGVVIVGGSVSLIAGLIR